MASIQLNPLAENMRGRLSRTSPTILRKKKYRADNGAVLNEGAQEAYDVLNPRNYKKNPPKGVELRNIQSFAEASRLTTLILRAGKYTDEELAAMSAEQRAQVMQHLDQLTHFKQRFKAQLLTPDPQAPILPKTDPAYNTNSTKIQRRQYRTLNTFIRAMLLQELKNA